MNTRIVLVPLLALLPLGACFCDTPVAPGPGEDAGDPEPDAGAPDAGEPERCENSIEDDVVIEDEADLAALEGVQCIFGSLFIEETALTNVDGLDALVLVTGDVTIGFNEDMTDLSALAALEEVGGDLEVSDSELLTALPLERLATVGGDLELQGTGVTNLDALSALTSLGGELRIISNPALTSISGLSGVTSLTGAQVDSNTALTSLDGLQNTPAVWTGDLTLNLNGDPMDHSALSHLTAVEGQVRLQLFTATTLGFLSNLETVGYLRLERLPNLTTADALSGITSLDALLIEQNPALTTLGEGLSAVTAVSGDLEIKNNTALTDLSGLDGLETVGGLLALEALPIASIQLTSLTTVSGDFSIFNDDALTNLDGFAALTTVGGLVFRIAGNAALPQAAAQALLDRLVNAGGYDEVAGEEILLDNDG